METICLQKSDRQIGLEDLVAWQDKYHRLYESHKRIQKVNQNLEDKLLKLVDRNSAEKAQLTSDVATLSVRLAQANYNIVKLQTEIERYKNDINLAIHFLQCKPGGFVSQKISSLPIDTQAKVSSYIRLETNSHSDSETSLNGTTNLNSYKIIPISDSPSLVCPFPPTAMVYSMRGLDGHTVESNDDFDQLISPSLMVKYLQDELKSSENKHCETCNCSLMDLSILKDNNPRAYSKATQTIFLGSGNFLCVRCNNNLNSPSRTNNPFVSNLVKSTDSIVVGIKSSDSEPEGVDDDNDKKLFKPPREEDLKVNPILSHHRLCNRQIKKHNLKLDSDFIDTTKINRETDKQIISTDVKYNLKINNRTECENNLMDINTSLSDINLLDTNQTTETNKSLTMHNYLITKRSGNEKCDLQSDVVQDTNSLCNQKNEGTRIFKNFNRKLIKTIKGENSKNHGPRMCALRMQNDSNNILLDNIESGLTPVIYTRRQRYLDDEQNDSFDIITSKRPMVMSNPINFSINNPNVQQKDVDNKTDTNERIDFKLDKKNGNINLDDNKQLNQSKNNKKILISQSDNTSEKNICRIYSNNWSEKYYTVITDINDEFRSSSLKPNLAAIILEENCNSENLENKLIKSCTLSSSLSSRNDADLQENFRSQQLTRVAEWVRNNSQLDKVKINSIDNTNCQNSSNIISDNFMVSSLSSDNHYMEKSNNFEFKNTKDIYNGIFINNMKHNQFMNNSVSLGCTDQLNSELLTDYNEFTNACCENRQKSFILSEQYFSEYNKSIEQKKKNSSAQAKVDLAQMEYNVKQFLLKENEWSTKRSETVRCMGNDGNESVANLSSNINSDLRTKIKVLPRRIETNL